MRTIPLLTSMILRSRALHLAQMDLLIPNHHWAKGSENWQMTKIHPHPSYKNLTIRIWMTRRILSYMVSGSPNLYADCKSLTHIYAVAGEAKRFLDITEAEQELMTPEEYQTYAELMIQLT